MTSTISPRWTSLPVGIGAMLRAARVDADLSRDMLAAALSKSTAVVQGLEEELRPPSIEVAERLCAALSLDPWRSALLTAVAVDTAVLRSRRGTRHVNRRGTPVPAAMREQIADTTT